MSPAARTLAALRHDGWLVEVVERWNPHARIRHDLFNVADVLAVRGAETLAVQVTSGSNVSARVAKLKASSALPRLVSAGWRVEIHGWRRVKVKRGGKAKRWACRVVEIDENLIRAELSAVERAEHIAKRKELWEAKQAAPESGPEKPTLPRTGRGHKQFAQETADATGESKREINEDVKRATELCDEARDLIRNTKLDTEPPA